MRELYIDSGITQSRAAVFHDKRLVELYVENGDDSSITGNIYKGRVDNVVNGLNAAFINIGMKKNAILQMDYRSYSYSLKRGQELLVQVTREGKGSKGPKLTTNISIPGKFIVLLPYENRPHISKKINNDKLSSYLKGIYNDIKDDGYGIIFRTECIEVSKEIIIEEYEYLKKVWKGIISRSEYAKAPILLYDSRNFLNFVMREYVKPNIDYVYTNKKKDFEYLSSLIKGVYPEMKGKVSCDEYNSMPFTIISTGIKEMLSEKFYLESGGYIVVNRTEALVSIDVNTGSFVGFGNKEDTILQTNLEACDEIFRVIRLLNLSGIILIDFIDMEKKENRELVIDSLENMFKKDRVPGKIYGFTNLGLLEISRSKKGKSLYENIYDVGYKEGYSVSYLLKEMENKCVKLFKHYKRDYYEILIEPDLIDYGARIFKNFSNVMKDEFGINIIFNRCHALKGMAIKEESIESNVMVRINEKVIYGSLIEIKKDEEDEVILKFKKGFVDN